MMNKKNILIISEGQVTEPSIYLQLKELDILPNNISIFSYGASLHDLIRLLERSDWLEYSDLRMTLIERERRKNDSQSEEKIKILSKKFTDILLVFDLDPQDPGFDPEKILKLIKIFHESSDNGMLYLSYPMIEALFDESICFSSSQLKGIYKSHVKKNNLYKHFKKKILTDKEYIDLLNDHINRANNITKYPDSKFHQNLFNIQKDFIYSDNKIYVISTALFFIIDYWGEKILNSSFLSDPS